VEFDKINVKFFAARAEGVRLVDFVPIFNRWIQESDGEYYDLADYSHVHHGPGILLIAHEANVSVDETGGRLGLLYNRKRPFSGEPREKLLAAVRAALDYAARLEAEPALEGRLAFNAGELLVLLNDRLHAPNTNATFEAARPHLEWLARALWEGAPFTLAYDDSDPRRRFSVRLKSADAGIGAVRRGLAARGSSVVGYGGGGLSRD
jgi:hypothetical protein